MTVRNIRKNHEIFQGKAVSITKNIFRRGIAFLLMLVMLSGMIGTDNVLMLVAFADDEPVETTGESLPADDDGNVIGEETEETAAPEPADETEPQAAAEEEKAVPQPTETPEITTEPGTGTEEPSEPPTEDAAGESKSETEPEGPKDEDVPALAERKIEHIQIIPNLEMALSGQLPTDASVGLKETEYQFKDTLGTLLYKGELQVFYGSGDVFQPDGIVTVEIKGELIRSAISEGRTIGLIVDERNTEAKLVKAENDTLTFQLTKIDLFVLYVKAAETEDPKKGEEPDKESDEYVFQAETVKLTDILTALSIELTENNYNVSVDSDAVKLSAVKVNKDGLAGFTLTALRSFSDVTLNLESSNGKDKHAIAISYAAPEEQNSFSYAFTGLDDSVMLLSLLRENGVKTVAVDDAGVAEGDEANVELLDYIGDYLVTPSKYFDRAVITAITREGKTYEVVFSCIAVLEEQTIPASAGEATVTLAGLLPNGAEVAVTEIETPDGIEAEDSVSFDITISGDFQPKEPITVTVSDPKIRTMVEAGMEILVVHVADDGTLEPIMPLSVEGDTVSFMAEHFSGFDIGGYLFDTLTSWMTDAFSFAIRGLRSLTATYTEVSVTVEEGLEVLGAWSISSSGLLSGLSSLWLDMSERTAIELTDRESLDVYAINNGQLDNVLASEISGDESVELGSAKGFALVRDSGYRHKSFAFDNVSLDGMMPKDASAEAEDASENTTVLTLDGELLAAYEISLSSEGMDYQPDAGHPILVEISNTGITEENADSISLWHIRDDGSKEEIRDFTVENGRVSFVAASFSVYAVIGTQDPGGETQHARRWYYFVYEDGNPFNFTTDDDGSTPINYMIVHNGDYLQNPGTPADPSNSGKEFLGWYQTRTGSVGNYTYADRIEFVETDGHQVYGPITDIGNADETVTLYARFDNAVTVTYMDENNAMIVRTDRIPIGDTIDLTRDGTNMHYTIYTPEHETEVFLGWATTSGNTSMSGLPTTLTVSTDVTLYPVIAPAHWIVFYTGPSGSGAEYIGDKHWTADDSLNGETLPVPKYPGYTFDGWYTAANGGGTQITNASGAVLSLTGNIVVDGETKISDGKLVADTTLYAKWLTNNATSYTVLFWAQKNTDAVGLANSDKAYDYLGAITRTAATGATVQTTYADRNLAANGQGSISALGNYFTYNSAKSDTSATVNGDGSTVLNVYYDRKTMTFNFKVGAMNSVTYDVSGTNYRYWRTFGYTHWGYLEGVFFPLTLSSSNSNYPDSEGDIRTDYAVWTTPSGENYTGTIYRSSNGNSTSSTRYTLTGLYGAPLTGWPHTDGYGWSYVVNGTTWSLSLTWAQFEITPTPTNGTTVWNLWQTESSSGVGIHYLGETLIDTGSFDPANLRSYNDTYYENFTMNPYNYYGSYESSVSTYEKAMYAAVTGKSWTSKSASDLNYTTVLGNDAMSTDSTVHPDDSLFLGYKLVGYRYGNGVWHDIDAATGSATGISMTASGESGDLYIYYARVRSKVDIYSEFSEHNPSEYKIAYGLDLYPIKDWDVVAGQNHSDDGKVFAGWYWDRALTQPVVWGVDDTHVPAHSTDIYAKWQIQDFIVELDFNGGETQPRQDTVFWLDYGQTIAEYANATREYVAWDSLPTSTQEALRTARKPVYRYHHFIYVETDSSYGDYSSSMQSSYYGTMHSGVNANSDSTWYAPKKAFYYEGETAKSFWDVYDVDENGYSVSANSRDLTYYDNGLYVKISDIDAVLTGGSGTVPGYRLVGWYEVDKATGRLADYPFDFSTQIKDNITLRAVWVRTGSYSIEYVYKDTDGSDRGFYIDRSGNMQFFSDEGGTRTYLDASGNLLGSAPGEAKRYSDQALVVVPAAPANNSTTQNFIGWRINGKVYYPGDTFRLDSDFDPLLDGIYNQVVVLEAVYGNIEKSSVTFDGNGGTYAVAGSEYGNTTHTVSGIKENGTVVTPAAADFKRTNYTLIGWARSADATEPDFRPSNTIAINEASNILYAVWERTYSITYWPNLGGGTLTNPVGLVDNGDGSFSTLGIKLGQSATLSTGAGFNRDGYVQTGWNTRADGSGTSYGLTGSSISNIRENINLYAIWEARYSIVYDANRGAGVLSDPSGLVNDGAGHFDTGKIYVLGQSINLSGGTGLVRDGYVLKGWNTAADGSGTAYALSEAYTIAGNLTLYAQWDKLLSITYHSNGGSGMLTDGGSYSYDGGASVSLTPAGNVVYNIRSGSVVTVSNGTGFERTGYTLIGWNSDRTAATNGTVQYQLNESPNTLTLTDSITLYAVWREKLSIVYNTNGGVGSLQGLAAQGSGNFSTGSLYDSGNSVTLHNGEITDGTLLSKSGGYAFTGWNTASDGSGTHYDLSGSYTITANTTLYAEWAKLYQITYDANTGSGDLQDGGSYIYNGGSAVTLTPDAANIVSGIPGGSMVTLSTGAGFVKYGFGIKGWSTDPSRTPTAFDPTSATDYDCGDTLTLTEDMTLYAIWDTAYLVTFDPRGGTWTDSTSGYTVGSGDLGPTYSLTVVDSDVLSAPTDPTKDDGTFAFWSTNANADPEDSATYAHNFSGEVHSQLILYAIYNSAAKVTFNVNGGVWDSGNSTTYYVPTSGNYVATVRLGQTVAEPIDPSRSGYMFLGWSTDSRALNKTDWSTTEFNGSYVNDLAYIRSTLFNFSTAITAPITLYAVWAETVTVTFDLRARGRDGALGYTAYDPYTYHHTWGTGNDSSYYVFRSATGNAGYWEYVVTIPKGDTVRQPSDPTKYTDTNATEFMYWTTTESYQWGGGSNKYYSYEIYAEPSYITRYDFSQPVLSSGLRLYTSWLSSVSMFDITVNISKTLTDAYNQNAGTFELPYTIRTYRYRAVRRTTNGATTATLQTDGYIGQPASVSSVLELTTTANSGTASTATGSITLHYWPDYGTEDGINYEYLFFEVIEIAEDVSDNYTLTVGNSGGNTQGFSNVTNGRIYAPFQLTAGMVNGRASYNYGNYYTMYWSYDNSHYFVNYDSYYGKRARNYSGWFSDTIANSSTAAPSINTTITFTNTRKYVNVEIGKNLTLQSDTEQTAPYGSFTFTATLTDNGVDRTSAMESNYQSFTLSPTSGTTYGTQTLILPVGSVLTVTEVSETEGSGNINNYRTSAAVTTGTVPDFWNENRVFIMTVPAGNSTVTVTNAEKPKAVPVTLTKTLIDPVSADETFTFTLQLRQQDGNACENLNIFTGKYATYDAATTTDSSGYFIFNNVSRTFSQNLKLPPEALLTITEGGTNVNNYVTTVGTTGGNFSGSLVGKTYAATIPEEGGAITFTNTRRNATVQIVKALDNGTPADETRSFDFTVTLYKGDGTTPISGFNVLTGAANQSAGANVTDASGVTTVTRTGAGTVDLLLPVGSVVSLSESLTGDNASRYTVSGSGGRNSSGWSGTSYTSAALTLSGDTVTFTNTHNTVTVTVAKSMVDILATGSETFGFVAALTDGGSPVTNYTISGANVTDPTTGKYPFHLGDGDTATLTIPYGASLVVTEDEYRQTFLENQFEACPFNTSISATGSGTINNTARSYTLGSVTAAETVTFTNTRKTVTVTVYKNTVDPLNPNRNFTFEGTVSSMAGELLCWYNVETGVQMASGTTGPNVTNAEGYVSFTLSNGQSKALRLPAGCKLVGAETNAGLYTTRIEFAGVNITDPGDIKKLDYNLTLAELGIPVGGAIPSVTLPGDNKEYTSEIPPWDCAIWFTNTKPYVPVTVSKTLHDPLAVEGQQGAQTFTYKLAICDRNGNPVTIPVGSWMVDTATGYPVTASGSGVVTTTLTLVNGGEYGTFTISAANGETQSQTLYLPRGSRVEITELDPDTSAADRTTGDPRYITTVQQDSGTIYSNNAITLDNISAATAVKFTNTRRVTPVKIVKVNARGEPLTGASFTLSGGLLASGSIATNGSSTVFEGTLYNGSSVTLTETAPTNYTAANGTVTITLAPDGTVTSDVTSYGGSVEFDTDTDTWVVKVKNSRNTKTVTVTKSLDDLMLASASFPFAATLTEADGTLIANYPMGAGVTYSDGEYHFTIADVSNGGSKSITLTIPQGATLSVREDMPAAQANAYVTAITGLSGTYDAAHSGYDELTRTQTFTNVTENATVTFINTRRTETVYIQKILYDILATTDQSFSFTATLYYADGTTPLAAYSSNGFSSGERSVSISLQNGETRNAAIIVPVDACLVVTENLTPEQANAYTTRIQYNSESAETITDTTVTARALADKVQVTEQSVMAFTNTRRTVAITLTKSVIGGAYADTFPFTVSLDATNYNSNGFVNGMRSDITLAAGDQIVLIVPEGVVVTVTEGTSIEYFLNEVTAAGSTTVTLSGNVFSFTASTDDTITVINYVYPAPTGVFSNTTPFGMLFLFGAFLAAWPFFGWLIKKRCREDDDPDPEGGGSPGIRFPGGVPPSGTPPDARAAAPPGGFQPEFLCSLAPGKQKRTERSYEPADRTGLTAREIGKRARERVLSQVILTRTRGWPLARGDPGDLPRCRNGPFPAPQGGIS